MTRVKLRLYSLVFIAGALFVVSGVVRAQEATVDQQTPDQRCGLAQNYLHTIQRPRDLRARVDRLQAYRYIYQRLEVFVIRLEKNNQPSAQELRAQLDSFKQATDAFKNDYEEYDQARESLVAMKDCHNQIALFQEKLQAVRTKRQKVYDDVVQIQTMLSPEITTQLQKLHETLLTTEGARASND
jgi:hypothetical protein